MSKIEDEWKPQTIWTLVQILLICEMYYTTMVEKLITHAWYWVHSGMHEDSRPELLQDVEC